MWSNGLKKLPTSIKNLISIIRHAPIKLISTGLAYKLNRWSVSPTFLGQTEPTESQKTNARARSDLILLFGTKPKGVLCIGGTRHDLDKSGAPGRWMLEETAIWEQGRAVVLEAWQGELARN